MTDAMQGVGSNFVRVIPPNPSADLLLTKHLVGALGFATVKLLVVTEEARPILLRALHELAAKLDAESSADQMWTQSITVTASHPATSIKETVIASSPKKRPSRPSSLRRPRQHTRGK